MKISYILAVIASLFIGCTNHSKEKIVSKSFIPNGKGYIKFHTTANKDSVNVVVWYTTFLPFSIHTNKIVTRDTVIQIEASFPVIANMAGKDAKTLKLMILPNDTLSISYIPNEKKSFSDDLKFEGQTGTICDYLSHYKLDFIYTTPPFKEQSETQQIQRIDSITRIAYQRLSDYNTKTKLPSWFIEYETNDIHFVSQTLKLVQYQHRYDLYHLKLGRKDTIESMRDPVLSKNEWVTDNLFGYLSIIRPIKYDTLIQECNGKEYLQYVQDNITTLRAKLSPTMFSYIVAAKISNFVDYENYYDFSTSQLRMKSRELDSLLEQYEPLITDSAVLTFLRNYKKEQINKVLNKNQLLPGTKAPSFSLIDLNGKKVRLSDFEGKVVCLNFWNVHCSPCISSIPIKNDLINQFKNQNFVLVNICKDNDNFQWRKIISDNSFNGIHLRCQDNWAQTLAEAYCIESYPHCTLIDPQGCIIKNKITLDSLEIYITKFLQTKN